MFFDGFPNPNGPVDVQTFLSASTADLLQMQTWRKPAGKSMAYMICIGGGGGGGGGFTGVAASARGGGGGGGSSGIATLTIPLIYLPDTLYIQVGAGGAGVGSGGGTAGSGVNSTISLRPSTGLVIANKILQSNSATVPTGGGTGTAAAVGAAGAAGAINTIATTPLAQFGQSSFIAGQAGAAGGAVAGAIGPPATIPVTGVRTMGGGGGAGTTAADFAGSIVTAITDSFLADMRPAGAAAGSNPGSGGQMLWKPFWSFCGLGGAASNAGVGGNGGPGAYGSGGGGGGGGTTGGVGGNGGNGIVIIVSW